MHTSAYVSIRQHTSAYGGYIYNIYIYIYIHIYIYTHTHICIHTHTHTHTHTCICNTISSQSIDKLIQFSSALKTRRIQVAVCSCSSSVPPPPSLLLAAPAAPAASGGPASWSHVRTATSSGGIPSAGFRMSLLSDANCEELAFCDTCIASMRQLTAAYVSICEHT